MDSAMQFDIGPHLDETELEQYSMGTLPEAREDAFEQHLLACDSCQDRLLETENFVNGVRSASPKLREERWTFWANQLRWPRPAWVAALALSAAALATTWVLISAAPDRTEMAVVVLQSSRGIEGLAAAKAPAGKPLSLTMDVTELPILPSYRLEIVGSMGKPVWQTTAHAQDNKITQPLAKRLPAGQYYVRLYTSGGELLREFSLGIK
jgi:hypothetical protein